MQDVFFLDKTDNGVTNSTLTSNKHLFKVSCMSMTSPSESRTLSFVGSGLVSGLASCFKIVLKELCGRRFKAIKLLKRSCLRSITVDGNESNMSSKLLLLLLLIPDSLLWLRWWRCVMVASFTACRILESIRLNACEMEVSRFFKLRCSISKGNLFKRNNFQFVTIRFAELSLSQ
ncbi:hypothetical protein WICPIJ_001492 [Wickerhamomyces pijperi]|uniref:Uncharacterized protein n=1 Tax=Wickerhamomyces pijperi TaxID=599730 RepID=A0A9P8TQP4_WICPI|nr:hypothetical protein WICPIJ_001492 [Wickerhamomyces pijperi]